ncbi:hypothetical protein BU23DRAFT_539585 [Bimuria novae-zelandiae CBS 107.79]|uniref:Zn(2)-C6 fungal-type domain-containing protein n=1 Tax=Bimuria novae-zelandiae CBS 107.79 TaxID=1447943 RepID=A0A6A5UZT6_9PLEO|nr:hypothetical protein BU23DRAFT_539585 [Bimuria novae-zelandiae CBS 107.79]
MSPNLSSTGHGYHRTKTACLNCTRRKVKCSKTVPCSNCLRRGEHDSCSLDPTASASSVSNIDHMQPHPDSYSSSTHEELNKLRRKVLDLEAQLEERESPPSAAPSSQPPLDPRLRAQTHPQCSQGESEDIEDDEDGPVVENAVAILEFLAWGKRKNPDYQSVVSPQADMTSAATEHGDVCDVPDGLEETSNTTNILQLLLPDPRQVWQLADYHESSLLWYHNSYHAPTFRQQLKIFYDRFSGAIHDDHEVKDRVNLQWVGLLFSILAGSMTCAPPSQTQAWGFKAFERALLSRKWFFAAVSSLNKADYTATQSILSVQTISTLTISAHLLGNSNTHAINLAAAIRIAQGLGLHRLTDGAVDNIVEKETGCRVWTQLCAQDWFSTSFYETYLINPLYSLTDIPINCHDDMKSLPDDVPTITSYGRFLHKIASIMPQLQDALMACNTSYTRYDQVLKWDKRLRTLVTTECPSCLSNRPIEYGWPQYVPWARHALAISSSHKIIMIHRSFLSESFVNPAFSFTRRTCLAASKTIIKEYKAVLEEDSPILWIYQAFAIAAAIILLLDVLHREPTSVEYSEHKSLVEDVVEILGSADSMIATRGTKLLSSLLAELNRDQDAPADAHHARRKGFNVSAFVKGFCDEVKMPSKPTSQGTELCTNENVDFPAFGNIPLPDEFAQDLFFHPPRGFEHATDFENLLYLANHDISRM